MAAIRAFDWVLIADVVTPHTEITQAVLTCVPVSNIVLIHDNYYHTTRGAIKDGVSSIQYSCGATTV